MNEDRSLVQREQSVATPATTSRRRTGATRSRKSTRNLAANSKKMVNVNWRDGTRRTGRM
jgi:hypothetical protein